MILKCKSTFFLIIFSILNVMGQQESNRFSFSGSEIVIDFLPENDMYFCHEIDSDVTVYNLTEHFQLTKDQLCKINKLDPIKPIKAGKIVKVTLDKKKIRHKTTEATKFYVIKYKVKKGDTFFKIQNLSGTDQKTLKLLNNKTHTSIQQDETLILGYYPKHISRNKKDLTSEKVTPENKTDPKAHEIVAKYYLSDVIGSFDKNSSGNGQNYVLHNEARPGSIMDVYNPMLKKHIKAKVVGKIPEGTYQSDIKIILNKSAASALNILDGRFKVNIKYEM
jgi:LysM repeat protein